MRVVDETLIANEVVLAMATGTRVGMPIDMVGPLVKLKAVHYGWDWVQSGNGTFAVIIALSSNPEHQETAPIDNADFMTNRALYGRHVHGWGIDTLTNGVDWAYSGQGSHITAVIPLYGLIRPARQAIVIYNLNTGGVNNISIELYYDRVEASRVEIAYYNDVYGKYRRD